MGTATLVAAGVPPSKLNLSAFEPCSQLFVSRTPATGRFRKQNHSTAPVCIFIFFLKSCLLLGFIIIGFVGF